MAREIIAHRIPFPFQAVQHRITELPLSDSGCQVSLNSDAECEKTLHVFSYKSCINATSDMTACVFVCMHVCKMLRTGAALGSHTAAGTGTPTYFMVCVCVGLCEIVCVCATCAPPRDSSSPILPSHP